MANISSGKMKK